MPYSALRFINSEIWDRFRMQSKETNYFSVNIILGYIQAICCASQVRAIHWTPTENILRKYISNDSDICFTERHFSSKWLFISQKFIPLCLEFKNILAFMGSRLDNDRSSRVSDDDWAYERIGWAIDCHRFVFSRLWANSYDTRRRLGYEFIMKLI